MTNFEKKMHEYMNETIKMCESENEEIRNEGQNLLFFYSKLYLKRKKKDKKGEKKC